MVLSRKNIAATFLGCVTAIHITAYLFLVYNEPPDPLPTGNRFPASALYSLDERAVSSESVITENCAADGKCVVVWISTRCPLCMEEIRLLEALYMKHGDSLAVVVISLDPCPETTAFRENMSAALPVYVLDRSAAKEIYHVQRVPTVFFIGQRREIVRITTPGRVVESCAVSVDEFLGAL